MWRSGRLMAEAGRGVCRRRRPHLSRKMWEWRGARCRAETHKKASTQRTPLTLQTERDSLCLSLSPLTPTSTRPAPSPCRPPISRVRQRPPFPRPKHARPRDWRTQGRGWPGGRGAWRRSRRAPAKRGREAQESERITPRAWQVITLRQGVTSPRGASEEKKKNRQGRKKTWRPRRPLSL